MEYNFFIKKQNQLDIYIPFYYIFHNYLQANSMKIKIINKYIDPNILNLKR